MKQIDQDHQIMMLNIAIKCFDSQQDEVLALKCATKAINLDLRIKLINEELTNVSERQPIQSHSILNYLAVLGKLISSHKTSLSTKNQKDLFQAWFVLNHQI